MKFVKLSREKLLNLVLGVIIFLSGTNLFAATPAFVQVAAATPQTATATVSVPFNAPQVAGDLDLVIVGWNDTTATVGGVADLQVNGYALAVGPTLLAGKLSQSIYYAKNIKAGANTVTVTFNSPAAFPDIRIVEYSGLDPVNPFDVAVAAAIASGTTSNSGSVTTTNAADLLVGANIVTQTTRSAGAGYTSRIITTPDSDIVEDANVAAVGSYSATAAISMGGSIMQLVALRASTANATPTPTPSPTPTPPPGSITIGNAPPNFSTPDSGNGNLLLAQKEILGQGATINTISFYVTSPSGTLVLGLYNNSGAGPGTLLASTATFTPVAGWNTAPVITPVLLAPGTYWLAYLPSSNALKFVQNPEPGGFAGVHFAAGPLPGTFPSPTLTGPGQWSLYATLTPNGTNPAPTIGAWNNLTTLPIVPVHSSLLYNGSILMSDGQNFGANSIVFNPVSGTSSGTIVAPANIFCSATEQLSNGSIIDVGGHITAHEGLPVANSFNPATNTWTVLPNMTDARWYPTATMLPSGNILVTSGESNGDGDDVTLQAVYNPTTNSWSAPYPAQLFPYYPHVYVLSSGKIIVPSTTEDLIVSQILDPVALTWTPVGGPAVDGGASAMFLQDKILKVGESVDPDDPRQSASTNNAYVLDLTVANPVWTATSPMNFPRTYTTLTILPDGTVLATGGGTTTAALDVADAVLPAELWNPATGTWTVMAAMSAPRLYHSEALLLPDGRVIAMGGGRFNNGNAPTDQFSAEFYSPPYLFAGTRPTIFSAPAALTYGTNFTVGTPNAAAIGSVALLRLGAVTHDINMGQRYVPLSFTAGAGALTVTAPANANLAPPGYYMLFILDTNKIPSVAAIVHF